MSGAIKRCLLGDSIFSGTARVNADRRIKSVECDCVSEVTKISRILRPYGVALLTLSSQAFDQGVLILPKACLTRLNI